MTPPIHLTYRYQSCTIHDPQPRHAVRFDARKLGRPGHASLLRRPHAASTHPNTNNYHIAVMGPLQEGFSLARAPHVASPPLASAAPPASSAHASPAAPPSVSCSSLDSVSRWHIASCTMLTASTFSLSICCNRSSHCSSTACRPLRSDRYSSSSCNAFSSFALRSSFSPALPTSRSATFAADRARRASRFSCAARLAAAPCVSRRCRSISRAAPGSAFGRACRRFLRPSRAISR
mmetsp:Transcript_19069/g.51692  ORF Transcript_19069/g.51692 Transcript_19069/m.51692 type:complete len:235 (-) Transcript_19069:299-1003(-)